MEAPDRPPQYSLPSYSEPTPETPQRISREEEAEIALGHTEASPRVRRVVTLLFLLTIASLPLLNLAAHLRAGSPHTTPGAALLALSPNGQRMVPSASEIKAAEKNLERDSIVSQYLLPRVQSVVTGLLHAGNEQAYPGRDGWLFYRPDVDYVTGPPFLDPTRLRHRARDLGIQPDPERGILQFKEELGRRGIRLIVLPIPAKPAIEAARLGFKAESRPLENPSFKALLARLKNDGVEVADIRPDFAEIRLPTGRPLYLESDTHWRPEVMQRAAERIARRIPHAPPGERADGFRLQTLKVTALGDIATMLKLSPQQTIYRRETVPIEQVQSTNGLWRPSAESDVLLLGDSFSNIYSLAAMGWGESAGFAEHLSYALGRPIDAILRNSDGAYATREILSRELARGRDRLAGKKVVIWEFAERELAFGDWKLLPLDLGTPKPATFFTIAGGEPLIVEATVAAISAVPRPGAVPYADHICTVHLVDLSFTKRAVGEAGQALAFTWSMRKNIWTQAARLRPGDRIRVRLSPWPGEPGREQINRSELSDPALQLEEPVWAEIL